MTGDSSDGGAAVVALPPDRTHISPTGGITQIDVDPEACLRMLQSVGAGRVALSIGALPAIVPVNFVLVDRTIAFPINESGIARRSTVGAVIAFETDGLDETGTLDWSVMVRGIARELVNAHELAPIQSAWAVRWPALLAPDGFVAIPTTFMSGHRVDRNLDQ